MKIKQENKLQVGSEIKWTMRIEGLEPEEYDIPKTLEKKIKLLVIANYSHHTHFRMLYRPYLNVCLTNQELFQRGIYKASDFENPFTVKGDEYYE